MRMVLDRLIGLQEWAAWVVVPLGYAACCRSPAASKKLHPPDITKTSSHTAPHTQQIKDPIPIQKKVTRLLPCIGEKTEVTHTKSRHALTHLPHTKPIFTLQDMTLQPGNTKTMLLKVTQWEEGYTIKSVAVHAHTTYALTQQFGLDNLKNRVIPMHGLTILLSANPKLKPGQYTCKLNVGKTGIGSKATLQSITCTITVLGSQPTSNNSTAQTTCDTSGEVLPTSLDKTLTNHRTQTATAYKETQNITEEPTQIAKEPNFRLQNTILQAGSSQILLLEAKNKQEGFIIKSVSVTSEYTIGSCAKAFGLHKLKQMPITGNGLTFTLTASQHVKPGIYYLKLILTKRDKGKRAVLESVTASITVLSNKIGTSQKRTFNAPIQH